MRARSRLAVLGTTVSLGACQSAPAPQIIDITAVNYAFRAPASATPGPTRFRLMNGGTVPHEVQLFRFRRAEARPDGDVRGAAGRPRRAPTRG